MAEWLGIHRGFVLKSILIRPTFDPNWSVVRRPDFNSSQRMIVNHIEFTALKDPSQPPPFSMPSKLF